MRKSEAPPRDLSSLAVVDAPLAELRGWDRNPRRIKPARLKQLQVMLQASPEMLKARPLICLPDDAALDPFAGSGSTMLACEQLGCAARMLEIDPAYCDVIRQRYADYVGDQKWAP